MGWEWVVHPSLGLQLAELLDRLVQGNRDVSCLGGGVVAVADVDLPVLHLIITNDEDKVI